MGKNFIISIGNVFTSRICRRERRLTQEQFAEAMGVTVGSVYKWETGQTIPELSMLVEIADFFDVSMDVLLGYRVKDNRIAAIEERIREYCRVRDPEALVEAEKALKKFPNSFEVVHGCAQVYAFFGVGSKDHAETRRALELYEQAKLLISQNHDTKIGEQTISGEMASAWMLLGEGERCIELLKKNNAGGVYSGTISTYSVSWSPLSDMRWFYPPAGNTQTRSECCPD